MLIILFGPSGVGKNFVGNILDQDFNFFFYDGDDDLTPAIKAAIKNKQLITDKLRQDYFNKVIKKIKKLSNRHKNLVFSQALTKRKYQNLISQQFPQAKFIKITAPEKIIAQRLKQRKHLIDSTYAKKVLVSYEEPKIKYHSLINDSDQQNIKKQLKNILSIN